MRKKLIGIAAAAAFTTPAAHAIDFEIEEGTTFSIYGTVEPKIIVETDDDGDDSTELDDEDSTLGFAIEHAFSDKVTGFAQVEFELSSDNNDDAFDGQDSAFLGVKGDFGRVQAGNFDSVYEDLIIDATEVAEDAEITDEAFAEEDNQIAYYSPDWGGFSFRTQLRVIGENDDEAPADASDNEIGFAIAGGYTADRWGVYLGYDDRGAETVEKFDSSGAEVGEGFADEGTFGVASIGRIGIVELAGKYAVQNLEDNDPLGDEIEFTALRGTVELDHVATEVYAAFQNVDEDNGEDFDEFTIGAAHDIYSNLSIWSEAGWFDRTNDAGDNFMIGAIYSF